MKLPKYINLFGDLVNEKKHSGVINYQRINDLLSEFEAVEIGEILAAGFIYEIYGIELDLEDQETKELFPHLQDRACRTQYRQLLTDFDVNGKAYDKRSENGRKAANIRWHGKGGKIEAEAEQETETEPVEQPEEQPKKRRPDPMSEDKLRSYFGAYRAAYSSFDLFRDAMSRKAEAGEITAKDKFALIELWKKNESK